MSLKIQLIIAAVLIIALGIIFHMVKKRSLELKYVLVWIMCDVVLLILDLFPDLINGLAQVMGISLPVNMIFFLGFIFSLIILFSLTVALSRVTLRVRKLAQKMAMEEDARKIYDQKSDTHERNGEE